MKRSEIRPGEDYGIWLPDKPPITWRPELLEEHRYERGSLWMSLKAAAWKASLKDGWGIVRGRVTATGQPYGRTTQGVEVAIAIRLERYGHCPLCGSKLLDEEPEIDERELTLVLHPASFAGTWDEALLWVANRELQSDRRRSEWMDEELRDMLDG